MTIQSFDEFRISPAIEPERALNIGVGLAAAPLWAGFFATAGAASAWWWTAAWTRGDLRMEAASFLPRAAAAEMEAIDDAVCDMIEAAQEKVQPAAAATEVPAADPASQAASPAAADGPAPLTSPVEELVELPVTEAAAEPLQAAAEASSDPAGEPARAPRKKSDS